MKSRNELHRELRQRILSLSGVTERQECGIHEDAFFVDRSMFMHIHGHGHCDIRLSKDAASVTTFPLSGQTLPRSLGRPLKVAVASCDQNLPVRQ
jgi:hypothetical protein